MLTTSIPGPVFTTSVGHKTRNDHVQQTLMDAGFGVAILPAAVSSYTGYATFAKPVVAVDEYEDWGDRYPRHKTFKLEICSALLS